MDEELGGGASRSTDPAGGTSSGTDVSLREYVAQQVGALDRQLTSEIQSLRRENQAASHNSDKAIAVAAHEAEERLAAHNGLIAQMQAQAAHFATRESMEDFRETNDRRVGRLERFQAMLIGGFIFVSFIGVANLVKVWTGVIWLSH